MQQWTEQMAALADVIGGTRQIALTLPHWSEAAISVELGYADTGGAGVELSLSVDGLAAGLWCEEQAWGDWIAPMLTSSGFASIPPELHQALASWALTPLFASAGQASLEPPSLVSVRAAELSVAPACVFTLRRGTSLLRLRVLHWPQAWLRQLALSFASPAPAPALRPRLPFALAAGYVELNAQQIAQLLPGNALMLSMSAAVERGQALVSLGNTVVRMDYLDEEQWKVDEVMTQEQFANQETGHEMGQELNQEPQVNHETERDKPQDKHHGTASLDGLTFSVVAEIGRIELTVEEMRSMQRGMILGAPATFDGTVLLRVGGRTIGKGQLLRVGERLAVRIQ